MTRKVLDFRAIVVACFAFFAISMSAQTSVTGVVLDSSGEPIIGATVREKGSQAGGTATDFDGKFALKVASTKSTLVVSYVGMQTQEVKLAGRTEVTIKMVDGDISLDEVVVVGYGTSRRIDITGSVSSLTADQMKESIVTNADQMLQGKVAGVQVTQNSGAPGGATSIRIRGASSINNSNEPLYVIDGVQMSGAGGSIGGFSWAGGSDGQNTVNPLAAIAPSDIVSIDVLKDASACAIYGAAGANGVVIVTTRRGKAGHTNVTYDGYVAWQQTAKRLDMMNLQQYAEYQGQLVEDGFITGQNINNAYRDPSILGKGTDWQDEIFRTAFMQNHQLSVSGGTEKVTFAASGGWMNQDGIIIGSDFSRFNGRFSVDAQMTPWMKLGGQLAYTRTNEKITLNDGSDGIIMQAMTMQPDVPVYDFDGNFAGPTTVNGSSSWNPVALALQKNNTLLRQRIMGNFYASIDFLKHFNFRAEYGYDASSNMNKAYVPRYHFGVVENTINQMYQKEEHSYFWVQKDYITYTQTFNSVHDVSVMAGFEAQESSWENISLQKKNMTTDNIFVMTGDGDFVQNSGYKDRSTQASIFGRVNYGYDNRYLATFTMRADGSSKFGPENKWGYFPSVALAWRASQESFLRDVNWLNNLKLRLGYGQVGNANISTYLYGSAMQSYVTPMGTGYYLKNIPNPSLKWEASEQFNAGIDFAAFNSRIELTVDVYKKQTKDLLLQMLIPTYLGGAEWNYLQAPYANIGKTENTGIDISLNTRNIVTKNFTWSSNLTISHNKNKVVALNDESQIMYGKLDWWSEFQTATMIKTGQPMGVFYGYQVDRLFTSEQDILDSPVQVNDGSGRNRIDKITGVYPGDIKFKDISGPDGVPDGVIDENDQTVIGDPNPDFTFGFTNTFTYKDFDLSIGLTGSVGGDILNFARYKTEAMNSIWDNQSVTVLGRARAAIDENGSAYLVNTDAELPRFSSLDGNRNNRMSTRWIEDGSYLRIQNVALSYHFPTKLLQKAGIASARVYLNVQNLYTFTGYKGYDPEIGAFNQSALRQNIDMGRYPTPRTYTLGLNLSF
ncbi:MAG: SusC/RagA family TonB-linked outer membrane protein [Muribaculaceae bacterium]